LAVAAALLVGGYLYFRLDDEIRRYAERLLAGHYRQLDVHVGRARFEQDRGVTIYDITIADPGRSDRQPMLAIDELFLACQTRLDELLKAKPRIERVVVRRPYLRAICQRDGHWNVQALCPLPKFSDQTPDMRIEDATLVLEDATSGSGSPLTIRGVDIALTANREHQAAPSGEPSDKRLQVEGTASGSPARELRFAGQCSKEDGSLDIVLEVRGLEISPELLASVPRLPTRLRHMGLSARADATVRLSRAGGVEAPLDWSADVALDRGRLDHDLLPQPLSGLTAKLHADASRMVTERVEAKCGTADVAVACERHGWTDDAPIGLAARVVGLPLDAHLQAILPAPISAIWQRFQPAGKVDAEAKVSFDGRQWQPEITAHCRGVSLTDAKSFPYRVEQTTGTVSFTPTAPNGPELRLNLSGIGGGRPIQINGQLNFVVAAEQSDGGAATAAPLFRPLGWLEITGSDIPIHEQLLAALPDKPPRSAQRFVRSLCPQGTIDLRWRAQWSDRSQPRPDIDQEIHLKDCSIQYDRFPYPLHHINGLVTAHNQHWTLRDIKSDGGSGLAVVTCHGTSEPSPAGSRLQLVFDATNVPLDEDLRRALSPEAQAAWNALRPQGRVDFVANLTHETGQERPLIEVVLRPHDRSVSIDPESFPYRLEEVDGQAVLTAGRADLRNITARHGPATYSASQGSWQSAPGGGWQFVLTGLSADRLAAQSDLLAAMPPAMQKIFNRLQPTGTFGLYNSILSFGRRPDVARLVSTWDVQLECHQVSLHGGLPLENITGGIRLAGRDDGRGCSTAGELDIDSVFWHDLQLTEVHGPLWVDESVCLVGQRATAKQGQPARRVTAAAYGGTIVADAEIQHDGQMRFQSGLALGGVDLARFANEQLGGPSKLSGTVSGQLALSGTGRSTHALKGGGNLHIVKADLYELPLLVALLKVLRVHTPDTTAFNNCDMQFDINGEHIHFRQLNLLGDALSLYGRGEANFDQQLNLEFYSLVGPGELSMPLLKAVVGQASQQILVVKVDGSLDKPNIHREALPAVNQMLQQIQSELQRGAESVTPPAAARNVFSPDRR
jgi:hypothetical protein